MDDNEYDCPCNLCKFGYRYSKSQIYKHIEKHGLMGLTSISDVPMTESELINERSGSAMAGICFDVMDCNPDWSESGGSDADTDGGSDGGDGSEGGGDSDSNETDHDSEDESTEPVKSSIDGM